MCGRTACTLSKENVQKACSVYDPKSEKYKELEWANEENGGREYKPSYNICPTDVTPVIIADGDKQILKPMVWGMIPPWHKEKFNNHKLSTNNCRIENILQSKMFKEPMICGKRCVVICDGFYEWQTTKKEGKLKQPFFIYAPQPEGVQIDKPESWSLEFSDKTGWSGPRMLCMAALYNVWTSPEGEQFWSYSIVTMESNSTFGQIHHRIPAVLDSHELIERWLKQGQDQCQELLKTLTPNCSLTWHPVSSEINNSRNKSNGLNRAIESNQPKKISKSGSMMEAWLRGGEKRKVNENTQQVSKKVKRTDSGKLK